jgi:formate/nitrite transporter FocA (FNT family)
MPEPTREAERNDAEKDSGAGSDEQAKITERERLSAVTVFRIIRSEGEEEMERPAASLWWSGVAAGLGISTSLLAQGILHQALTGQPWAAPVEALGYTLGFMLVILSRLQLFTENTLSVVLPVFAKPSLRNFLLSAKLWAIVLAANFFGTFATALIALTLHTASPEHLAGMLEVSRHAAQTSGWAAAARGIPAGFYMASIVWMLPSAKGFEIVVIGVFSWLIAAGEFSHVVASSTEMFMLVLNGELSLGSAFGAHLLPALGGNIIGGTGLFAVLAFAQIKSEIEGAASK